MTAPLRSTVSGRLRKAGLIVVGIGGGGVAAALLAGLASFPSVRLPTPASALQRDVYQALEVFHGALMLVREQYLEPVEAETLMDGAIRGIFDALDDDSTYLSAEETERYRRRAEFPASIGIGLEKRYYIHVDDVLPGSPAEAAGLEEGAALVSIAGRNTRDLRIPAARLLLAGAPGSSVELGVRNEADADSTSVVVERAVLPPPPVESGLDGSVATARIRRFHAGAADELGAALADLRAAGAGSLVLDLRGSRGWGVDCGAGVEAAGRFTSGVGSILARRGPGGREEETPAEIPSAEADPVWDGPLLVLIAEDTVCPGEVLAAALSERPDTEILGRRTAGRTGVAELVELPAGDALLLTTAHYQTPDGEDILGVGVPPTRSVSELEEELGIAVSDLDEEDPWMDLAVRYLRRPPG